MDEIEDFVKERSEKDFYEEHIKLVEEKAEYLLDFYEDADQEVVRKAALLHDVVHPTSGYKKDDHNIASAKEAEEFLHKKGEGKEKIEEITYCIECHRSSRGPEPETIEAKIVASADNLSHFDNFEWLKENMGEDYAMEKLKRNLSKDFMLPEAVKYAEKKMEEIKEKIS